MTNSRQWLRRRAGAATVRIGRVAAVLLSLALVPVLYAIRERWSLDAVVPDPRLDGGLDLVGRLVAGFSVVGGDTALALFFGALLAWLLIRGQPTKAAFGATAFVLADVLDRSIKVWVRAPRPAMAGEVAFSVQGVPDQVVVAIIGGLILAALVPVWRRAALTGAASLAAVYAFEHGLDALLPIRSGLDGFPSGHATGSAVVAAITVTLAWPTRRRLLAVVGALALVLGVGLSRLYLDVHYPADVVAGWCLAVAAVSAAPAVSGAVLRRVTMTGTRFSGAANAPPPRMRG